MTDPLVDFISHVASGDDARAEHTVRRVALFYNQQPEQVSKSLDSLLNSPLADDRWWALRVWAEIPGIQAQTRLVAGLKDSASAVRQCSALGLRYQPDPGFIANLIEALSDTDDLVVQLAGDALIALGAEAVPFLLDVIKNDSNKARLEAVRTLATIGDERSIPALFSMLDDDSLWIEYWANLGLEKMGVGMSFFLPD